MRKPAGILSSILVVAFVSVWLWRPDGGEGSMGNGGPAASSDVPRLVAADRAGDPTRVEMPGLNRSPTGPTYRCRLFYADGKPFPATRIQVVGGGKSCVVRSASGVFEVPMRQCTLRPVPGDARFEPRDVEFRPGRVEAVRVNPLLSIAVRCRGLEPGRSALVSVIEDSPELARRYGYLFAEDYQPARDPATLELVRISGGTPPVCHRIDLPYSHENATVRLVVFEPKTIWSVVPGHEAWFGRRVDGRIRFDGRSRTGPCPISAPIRLSIGTTPVVRLLFYERSKLKVRCLDSGRKWWLVIRRWWTVAEGAYRPSQRELIKAVVSSEKGDREYEVPPGRYVLCFSSVPMSNPVGLTQYELKSVAVMLESGDERLVTVATGGEPYSFVLDERWLPPAKHTDGMILVSSAGGPEKERGSWLVRYRHGRITKFLVPTQVNRVSFFGDVLAHVPAVMVIDCAGRNYLRYGPGGYR